MPIGGGEKLDNVLLIAKLDNIASKLADQSQKDWLWDLVLPISSSIFIALLTAILTYIITQKLFVKSKEIELENQKIETINKTNRVINSCLTSLISIKDNYRSRLTEKLCERILQVPVIKAARFELVDSSFLDRLFFIHPTKEEQLSVSKWSQVTQIEGLLHNYNSLMEIWRERNQMLAPLIQAIGEQNYQGKGCLADFNKLTSPAYVQGIIQLTETAIHLTDEISDELHDLLCKFPQVYEPKLNKKYSKTTLLQIFEFDKDDLERRRKYIQKSIDADYSVLKNFCTNEEYEQVIASFKPIVTMPDID